MSDDLISAEQAQALMGRATEGPWELAPHGVNDCLSDVWFREDECICENASADNARLIAAAPDLARAYIAQAAEITRLRAQVKTADVLTEAVTGLVSMLDQNETKGPISDVQLMFCWLAAQDVRAAAKGAKAK